MSLLAWVGCIVDSHEMATWFDDDRQLRADSYPVDTTGLPLAMFMLRHLGGGSWLGRTRTLSRFLVSAWERRRHR